MNTNIYCEKCKNNDFLVSKTEGRISGLFCEKCKLWAVVTSNFSEMEIDDTIYKVYFKFNDNLDIDEIKAWSHIFGMNYIQFKKGLLNNTEFIYSGNATRVFNILNKAIESNNVSFHVEPKFPFNYCM